MSKSVIVIGASGHGKVVADIIRCAGDEVAGFLDDNKKSLNNFIGYPVLGSVTEYEKFLESYFVVAIGNAEIRQKIADRLQGVKWYTAIHPTAVISQIDVEIGEGTVVMANAVVNSGVSIGKHCIINSGAVVEHDNIIEDFVHISVGVKLAGTVHIGKRSWFGIGAVISNNISVCPDCMIGAGGVVVKDISESGIFVGVPVKKLEKISL